MLPDPFPDKKVQKPLAQHVVKEEPEPPTRVVKAASGVKKFLTNRLGKIKQIFQRDQADRNEKENEAYLVESDDKHPDKWEKV